MMDQEESQVNIDGQIVKTVPLNIPDDVITYISLPSKAQLIINAKLRVGEQIPAQIYVKRKKGRPARDSSSDAGYFTPVYQSGQIDQEVVDFFQNESPQIG